MRNMSFIMTTEAFKSGRKTVTRRLGWWDLELGAILMGVVKSQGIKKGEHIVRLHPFEVITLRVEPLEEINSRDLVREGFPDITSEEFIEHFMRFNARKCREKGRLTPVNRIEFRHLSLCPGCLVPVAYLEDYCGECLCEEDGI